MDYIMKFIKKNKTDISIKIVCIAWMLLAFVLPKLCLLIGAVFLNTFIHMCIFAIGNMCHDDNSDEHNTMIKHIRGFLMVWIPLVSYCVWSYIIFDFILFKL